MEGCSGALSCPSSRSRSRSAASPASPLAPPTQPPRPGSARRAGQRRAGRGHERAAAARSPSSSRRRARPSRPRRPTPPVPRCSATCNPAPATSSASATRASDGIVVTTPTDTPPQAFYSSQTINDGFGYLKTRDGTLLSINVKLPGPAALGPYPTVIEYSGYDPSNPAGQTAGVDDRAGARLRDGGREPPRHRLLRWRVALLRDPAVARRLRRGRDHRRAALGRQRQGRHGRDLVPRHHAALRRADPPAAPRRDHAAVGDRRHARRRSTRAGSRTTASRSAGRRTAPPTPRPRARSGRPTGSPTATRCARRTRRCACSHRTCSTRSTALRYDDGAAVRRARAGDVRRQDQRPGVPGRLVAGRRDRRALRRHARRLRAGRPGEVHAHERRAQRRARPRGRRALGRVPRLLRRAADPDDPRRRARARRRPADAVLRAGREAAARSLHRVPRLRIRARRVPTGAAGARARRRRRGRRTGHADPRVRAVVPVVAAADDAGHHVVPRRRRRRS